MKNLNYIFFVLALSFVVQINAQQDPHFGLYKYSMNIINPAFAGIEEELEMLISTRTQWVNFEGSPKTLSFNANMPVGNNLGVGLSIVNDNVFVLDETHLYADISYNISLDRYTELFLGIKAGGSFLNIDLLKLGVTNDPLFSQNTNSFNPNVGIGFLLKGEKYYASLSAPGLLNNTRYEKEGIQPVEANDRFHMYLGGGYEFEVSDNWKLSPSALIKTAVGSPTSIDLTTTTTYMDLMEVGANYRFSESISAIFTMRLEYWGQIGYVYEHTLSDINKDYSINGSHEIIFKFFFGRN